MDGLPGIALARDEVTGIGSAMAGGKGKLAKTKRREMDFYPTPAECTRALLIAESVHIAAHGRQIWEMCGRGGAIARVLRSYGYVVVATDIVPDPGNDVEALDVLAARAAMAAIGFTNPPFAIAAKIIAHLLGTLGMPYLALLLKTNFWSTDTEHGRVRLGLYRRFPPSMRWDLTWRPDFLERQSGRATGSTMKCSWFVWDVNRPAALPAIPYGLLARDGPVMAGAADLFTEEAADA